MEAITWLTHKYVMHGFLWYLHEDHHQPKYKSLFEKNDLFFVIFASPEPTNVKSKSKLRELLRYISRILSKVSIFAISHPKLSL